MTLPNFLIIGVEKSGTTALWFYLKQHPEIFMTELKEPCFFAYEDQNIDFKGPGDGISHKKIPTKYQDYIKLFEKVTNEKAIGEASPIYFRKEESAEKIKKYIPNVKLILILRNPVDRTYSKYLQLRRDGREVYSDFETAISKGKERIRDNYAPFWDFIAGSLYSEKLKKYFELFPREQIKIYLYDNFRKDNLAILKDIFAFLEVDESFKPNTNSIINDSFVPKNRLLHMILDKRWDFYRKTKRYIPNKISRQYIKITSYLWKNNKLKPKLPMETRQKLIDIYREDIIKTQELIGKDLSMWLQ